MFSMFRTRPHRPCAAPGERWYAIGDIHGRSDLLVQLATEIAAHDCPRADTRTRLIFLGDLIDRGPDSARCVAVARELVMSGSALCLMGNHEDMMLATLDYNSDAMVAWLALGGDATIRSYGVDPPDPGEDVFDFADRLRDAIPTEHIDFLRSLPTSHRSGDYLFVHAGVRPGRGLARQERGDLIGIRAPFLKSTQWHGAMVVHGHTIVDAVEIRPNRIAIDTGAWASGRLSCLCIDGDTTAVLTTHPALSAD